VKKRQMNKGSYPSLSTLNKLHCNTVLYIINFCTSGAKEMSDLWKMKKRVEKNKDLRHIPANSH
jgi:hypothetical protein